MNTILVTDLIVHRLTRNELHANCLSLMWLECVCCSDVPSLSMSVTVSHQAERVIEILEATTCIISGAGTFTVTVVIAGGDYRAFVEC